MEYYKQLEEKYAKFTDSKYAVTCNSGTAALHLGLLALGIKPGDEVIVPDFTMAACGFAVSYCGATPVFVDCDITLCIDWKLIEAKITPKTKAIMPVHIYGRLCNMPEILKIAHRHGLKVIEDACEAQGAVRSSKADITCYSFYKNKIIHGEEGGICTTNKKEYADRINYLKNMAFGDKHDYFHEEIGYNYRMPESQAEMILGSLRGYPKERDRRRKLEKEFYGKNIHDAVWVLDYFEGEPLTTFVIKGWWMIKDGETRPFFKPLSSFPMYGGKCQSSNAKYYSERGHYLKI